MTIYTEFDHPNSIFRGMPVLGML
ncbi:hypothetical protein SMJ63A_50081 [Stenotrophomonas geniculata]